MRNRSWMVSAATLWALLLALPAGAGAAEEVAGVVNVNTASEEQLQLLPRVGPAIAKRIVEFREQNRPFRAPEELLLVRGIGERTYELLEPYVTVSGDTTLTEPVPAPRRGGGEE